MIGRNELMSVLLNNVVEIVFLRRIPIANRSSYRRMWCTNSSSLLNSFNGRTVLNYKIPTHVPKFNPATENIIITWDLLMQDFRCINMDSCDLVQSVPANQDFWKFFNENIYVMSTQQKMQFMDS
jgi:hypothetical protein